MTTRPVLRRAARKRVINSLVLCARLRSQHCLKNDDIRQGNIRRRFVCRPNKPVTASSIQGVTRNVLKSLRAQLQKAIDSARNIGAIEDFINFGKLTSNISYHFATGNWSLQKGKMPGVVQSLSNMSHYSRLSHLRRTSTPMNREGKNPEPRLLKPSQWGLLCPAETPEGQAVGLVKNLALMAYISVGSAEEPILLLLEEWATVPPPRTSNLHPHPSWTT